MGVETCSSAPPFDVVFFKGHPLGPDINQTIFVKRAVISMKIYITHLCYSSWSLFLILLKAI